MRTIVHADDLDRHFGVRDMHLARIDLDLLGADSIFMAMGHSP